MAKPSRRSRRRGGIKCSCEKVCFSEDGAASALLNAKIARALHRSQKRKEIRAYFHHDCGHWHLTSKEEHGGGKQEMQAMPEGTSSDSDGGGQYPSLLQEAGGSGNEGIAARPGD